MRILALGLTLLVLAACSSAPVVQKAPLGMALPAPQAVQDGDNLNYRLGPEDVLEINVFGVPDLNRTVRVNGGGTIKLPLIGQVEAGGHTVPELQALITDKLAASYLQNPQVSVFVKKFASRRVTVGGMLNNPGIYPVDGTTTLMQALALAGGVKPLARTDGVVVFRSIEGRRLAAVFDLDKITDGEAPDPDVYPGDIIMVHKSGRKGALHEIIRATPLIGLFLLL